MNIQQIASRIGDLEESKGQLEQTFRYFRDIGQETRCDEVAEALSEIEQELHELRLAQSEV